MNKHIQHPIDDRVEDHFAATYDAIGKMTQVLPGYFEVLNSTNELYTIVRKSIMDSDLGFVGNFLMRSRGSFLVAASLAASGQLPDSFGVSRAILEVAGYGLLMARDKSLINVWFARSLSDFGRKTARGAFSTARIKNALAKIDSSLELTFTDLYERSISFGAHPNAESIIMSGDYGESESTYYYIYAIPSKVAPALDNVIKCALFAIMIFREVYRTDLDRVGTRSVIRTAIVGIHEKLGRLIKTLPPDFP